MRERKLNYDKREQGTEQTCAEKERKRERERERERKLNYNRSLEKLIRKREEKLLAMPLTGYARKVHK